MRGLDICHHSTNTRFDVEHSLSLTHWTWCFASMFSRSLDWWISGHRRKRCIVHDQLKHELKVCTIQSISRSNVSLHYTFTKVHRRRILIRRIQDAAIEWIFWFIAWNHFMHIWNTSYKGWPAVSMSAVKYLDNGRIKRYWSDAWAVCVEHILCFWSKCFQFRDGSRPARFLPFDVGVWCFSYFFTCWECGTWKFCRSFVEDCSRIIRPNTSDCAFGCFASPASICLFCLLCCWKAIANHSTNHTSHVIDLRYVFWFVTWDRWRLLITFSNFKRWFGFVEEIVWITTGHW